jgi:uncharacterized protein (TIRG00374 family)
MNKKLLWLITGFIITGLGVYVLIKIDISILKDLTLTTLGSLAVLTIAFISLHTLGVRYLLKGMGQTHSWRQVFLTMTAGGAAAFVGDPKFGIPVRVFFFKSILDIPIAVGSASIVLETGIWLFIITAIMIIPVPEIWGDYYFLISLCFLFCCTSILFFFLFGGKIKVDFIYNIFKTRFKKISKFIHDFSFSIKNISKFDLLKTVLTFVSGWLVNALSLYVVLLEYGWKLNLIDLLYIGVFAYLIGTFSMLPMGLGTRDASLVYFITKFGPSYDIAVVAALVQRLFRLILPLIVGLITINIIGFGKLRNPT